MSKGQSPKIKSTVCNIPIEMLLITIVDYPNQKIVMG